MDLGRKWIGETEGGGPLRSLRREGERERQREGEKRGGRGGGVKMVTG